MIDFIENLYELAETCQFGTLKEELIRDRIAVGIRNATLSQKLMQDDTLTLDKAVKQAKSSELVKEHHEIKEMEKMEKLTAFETPSGNRRKIKENCPKKKSKWPPAKKCYRCGKSPAHKREKINVQLPMRLA